MFEPYLNLWHLTRRARLTILSAVDPPEPTEINPDRERRNARDPAYVFWDASLHRLADHLATLY